MEDEFEDEEYLESDTARDADQMLPNQTDEGTFESWSFDGPNQSDEGTFETELNVDGPNQSGEGTFESESNVDATEVSPDHIFVFNGVFFRCLYRGQLRPREFRTQSVGGDSLQDILDCIWNVSKSQMQRQIVFDGDVPKWSEKQSPDQDDIGCFITLYDQSKKKTYTTSAITPRVLTTWRGKDIKIHVYVYSTNVETAAQYQAVLRQLITPSTPDRAGAHSTRDDAALAQALRDTHPHLEGHQSSWLLWSNFIHSSPAHMHEKLKAEQAPPLELSKYFRWTAVSEPLRLQAVHRGLTVAHTINDGWMSDVKELKDDVDRALAIMQSVQQRINLMAARGSTGTQLFTAMEDAVRPEESELSRKLANQVVDCPDIDHA